jgi:hypothetical protein
MQRGESASPPVLTASTAGVPRPLFDRQNRALYEAARDRDRLLAETRELRKVVDAATALVVAWCPDDSPEQWRLHEVVHELWASQDDGPAEVRGAARTSSNAWAIEARRGETRAVGPWRSSPGEAEEDAEHAAMRGALPEGGFAYEREDWHEDYGAVLWWTLPVSEPPYVGTPLDDDFPGYVTHWTRLPPVPRQSTGEEGATEK